MPPREQAAAPSSAQAQEQLGKLGRREEGQSLGGFGSLPFHQLLASQKNGRVQSQAVPPREHLAAQGPPEHSDPSPGVSLERFPSGFYPWSPNAHSPETQLLSSPCPHRRRLAQNIPRGSLEHSNTSCRLLRRVTEPLWVLRSKKNVCSLTWWCLGAEVHLPAALLPFSSPYPCAGGEQKGGRSPGGSLCHLLALGLMQALPQTRSYQGCGFSSLFFLQKHQWKPACPMVCPTVCPMWGCSSPGCGRGSARGRQE